MEAVRRGRVREVLAKARGDGRTQLLEPEVYRILQEAGVAVPRHLVLPAAGPPERWREILQAGLGPFSSGKVVLKVLSPEIPHKTEAGGIEFVAAQADEIVHAAGEMLARISRSRPGAPVAGLLVCERIEYEAHIPGRDLLLSLRQDPAMGPTIVVGIGGLLTEWYGQLAPQRTTWLLSAHDPILESANPLDLAGIGPAFELLFRASRLHAAAPIAPEAFWTVLRSWADLARTFGLDQDGEELVLAEIEVNPLALPATGPPVALDGIGRIDARRPAVRRRPIRKIEPMLYPRSVAVVGASGRTMNAGRIILRNLRFSGGIPYGHVHAVHPREEEIESIPCVPSIEALPERVDLGVVAVPAEAARDAIRDFVDHKKAHSIILIPGGFAETGAEGLAEEIVRILDAARSEPDGGVVLLGGNCLGIVSKHRYNTFFLPQYKLPLHEARGDNLAAISQSGAYLVTLTSNLDGVIYPKASISYGNQMDLTVSDLVEHYLDDPEVQVLACYIEGFQPLDGLRFLDLARRHRAAGRTVIVFKAGKTALGAQAAASHTASLAGDYPVARSLLLSAGVVVAETLNQFEDLTKVFTLLHDRIPTGCRVGLISNAGFECSAGMDALYDLAPARFSEMTRRELASCLPGIAHPDNPVDATPMATTEQMIAALEAILADPGVDAVVVSAVPVTPTLQNLPPDPTATHSENIYSLSSLPQELIRVFRSTSKPIVAAVDSGRLYDDCVNLLQRAGIPTYRKIDRATRALSRYCTGRLP